MAGQIHEWMKDGGVDIHRVIDAFKKTHPGLKSPLQHIMERFQPAVDTAIGSGKVLRDAAKVAVGPGVDAARDSVYRMAGLQPNDPSGYSDAAAAELAKSTKELAGAHPDFTPVKQAFGSLKDMLRSSLESSGTPLQQEATPGPDAFDQLVAPASAPAVAPGGAPVAPTRVARNSAPAGALALPGEVAPVASNTVGALPQAAEEAVVPDRADVQAEGKTLAEMFKERMDQIPQAQLNQLTTDQRQNLQLQFFLNLMARGGQKGSDGLLGNMGKAGLDTLESSRIIKNQNNRNETDRRNREDQSAFRELSFADRDADNKTNARRFEIMEKRLSEGKWSIQETEDGHVMMDDKGNVKPIPGNIKLKSKDSKGATIELLNHIKKNPKDLEILKQIRGGEGGGSDDSIKPKDRATMILKLMEGNGLEPGLSIGEATNTVDQILGRAKAAPPAPKGRDAIAHLPPAIQKQALEIQGLVADGKMTREQALKRLKSLGL